MAHTNARLKYYPHKIVEQVASREIFPMEEPEQRRYSVPPKGHAKDPARSLAESKRRAATAVRDIALCNSFSHMFTWTLNPELIDSFDEEAVYKKVRIFLSNCVQRKGFQYLVVPERHKKIVDGKRALHFHGLCVPGDIRLERAVSPKGHILSDNQGRPIFNMLDWRWGFSTCVPLDDHYERTVSYITKYILKGEEKILGKWYLSSRNLKKKPDIVTIEPISFLDFRDEAKLKVHNQTEIEIYKSVYLVSEEFPRLEDTNE